MTRDDLLKIHEALYEIPASYREDMRVAAQIFTNDTTLDDVY